MKNVEFQIWYKVDTTGMSAELAKKFMKADGTEPEFLAVSRLDSMEDAQEVLEQEKLPGYKYFIKQAIRLKI
jgi:hypothetical protein